MIWKIWARHLKRRTDVCVTRTLSHEHGGIAVLAAIVFPVVIGGLGLWVETGYWYLMQRQAQHIADVTAYSAGARLRAGDDLQAIRLAAQRVAVASGLDLERAELEVNIPPRTGPLAGVSGALEVVVGTRHERWFTALFASDNVAVAGRAVIRIEGDEIACMLALSRTAARAVSITGSTSLSLQNCDIVSNSSASDGLYQTASLSAYCGYSVGGAVSTGPLSLSGCNALRTNAAAVRDPYADVPQPANFGPCFNLSSHPTTVTTIIPTDPHPSGIPSVRFCGGLDFKGSLDLQPGLYILDGGTTRFTGGTVGSASTPKVTGSGVTFILVNGARLAFTGNVQLELTAPTTGPLSGILFFGSRTNTVDHTLNGAVGSFLGGAVYLPAANVTYSGRSQTVNGCTQIIANTIALTGSSQLSADCTSTGTRALYSTEIVRLLE
jgi:hypothetical protein